MITMKRRREEGEVETLDMARCLMLLTRVGESSSARPRVFKCKTCNRQFPSFQALGGHRTSHKRPKRDRLDLLHQDDDQLPAKPKTHECPVCGLEFAMGQALGGHMRRHRAAAMISCTDQGRSMSTTTSHSAEVPMKKSSSSKRVLCFDLNLTPYENDLQLGNITPAIN